MSQDANWSGDQSNLILSPRRGEKIPKPERGKEISTKNQDGNPTATDVEILRITTENEKLREENKQLREQLDELTKQLRAANDLIESQTRAQLIAQIQSRSDYGIEYLSKKTVDELREILAHFDHIKVPGLLMGKDTSEKVRPTLADLYGTWRVS